MAVSCVAYLLLFRQIGVEIRGPWVTVRPALHPSPRMRTPSLLLALLFCSAASSIAVGQARFDSAVYAYKNPEYKRKVQPNGSYVREYYAISNGGAAQGTVRGAEVDEVTFAQLSGVLAEHLGRKNYFLARNKAQASLLLVIHWGASLPYKDGTYRTDLNAASSALSQVSATESPADFGEYSEGSAAAAEFERALDQMLYSAHWRDQQNGQTARILGYSRELMDAADIRQHYGGGQSFRDLLEEIEQPRYYVFVSAYDFPRLVNHGERKLLWRTRVSMRTQDNRFADRLGALIASATPHFGEHRERLVRKRMPNVTVEIGEATVVHDDPGSSSDRPQP